MKNTSIKQKKYLLSTKEVSQVTQLLINQWTLSSIYGRYYSSQGVSIATFRAACKEEGIQPTYLRASGLSSLRAKAFTLISSMDTEEAEFNAAIKYLTKYDNTPQDEETDDDTRETPTLNVKLEIMKELSQ